MNNNERFLVYFKEFCLKYRHNKNKPYFIFRNKFFNITNAGFINFNSKYCKFNDISVLSTFKNGKLTVVCTSDSEDHIDNRMDLRYGKFYSFYINNMNNTISFHSSIIYSFEHIIHIFQDIEITNTDLIKIEILLYKYLT